MFQFENNLAKYCKKRGFDGVICGHIHHAEIKEIDGVTYMNDGDWVESCTALVEHHDGRWEIVTWTKDTDHESTENNKEDVSSMHQPRQDQRKENVAESVEEITKA
jgi:predicted phosphodiesterase